MCQTFYLQHPVLQDAFLHIRKWDGFSAWPPSISLKASTDYVDAGNLDKNGYTLFSLSSVENDLEQCFDGSLNEYLTARACGQFNITPRLRHDDFSGVFGKKLRDAVIDMARGIEYNSSSEEEEDIGKQNLFFTYNQIIC